MNSPIDLNYLNAITNITYPFFLTKPSDKNMAILIESLSVLADSDEVSTLCWQNTDEGISSLKSLTSDYLSRQEALDELDTEYNKLFIGPTPLIAPPWGSVYMDPDKVLYGSSWIELRTWMKQSGIEFTYDGYKDPEDHIGILLAMMAFVSNKKDERLTIELLTQHILIWSHHYLTKLKDAAYSPFYKGLATFTDNLLEGLITEYRLEVSTPRYYR